MSRSDAHANFGVYQHNFASIGLFFVLSCSCWSFVGDLKLGKQQISIGSFCYFHGIVVHEIGHALGMKDLWTSRKLVIKLLAFNSINEITKSFLNPRFSQKQVLLNLAYTVALKILGHFRCPGGLPCKNDGGARRTFSNRYQTDFIP